MCGRDGSVWQWLYRPTSPVAANVQSFNPIPGKAKPLVSGSRCWLSAPNKPVLDRHGVTLLAAILDEHLG